MEEVAKFVDNTKKHGLSENRNGIMYVHALTVGTSRYHMTHRWLDSEVKSHLVRWFRLGPFYGERDTIATTRTLV